MVHTFNDGGVLNHGAVGTGSPIGLCAVFG